GVAKQPRPPAACASTRKRSEVGAEQNHLCPDRTYSSPPVGVAVVVLARTSEPPCLSVIAMPQNAPSTAVSRGSHSAASSGAARSAGTAANVIVIGQPNPA